MRPLLPHRDLLLRSSFIQRLAEAIAHLADQLPPELAVLVGTVVTNAEAPAIGAKNLYNAAVWLENGALQQTFHKRLLPTYDVFDEDRYFAPGLTQNLMEIDGLTLGVTICEDLWNDEEFWGQRLYPENPVADLVTQGADVLVNLSASPFCVGKQNLRESLLKHAAQRFKCPIIYVNQVGGNDDLVFDGRSVVMSAAGDVLLRGASFHSNLAFVDWQDGYFATNYRAQTPVESEIVPESEVWQALVLGVQDYAQKCGFSQALLGLSGGIDSSLVAAIAVEALGAENVLGVLMPSPYSSQHSITDALALAQRLGMRTETIPIQPMMESFETALADLFKGTESGIAEENIQSRTRGNLLMSIANKFNYLLLTTGNKSELAVGYCTLYGDMSGGLAAIADVPKTLVFRLCRWLNDTRRTAVIPESVISKPPSAELRPGQLDEDSLPPYEILDQVLKQLIDEHQSAAEIIALGYEPETVNQIAKQVKRAEFKRYQAAPGIKITDRAFGTGWRMPIAAS
ncbi:MAG: NAD+ synthase [Cyanobacteria bacterium P01_F01_bin.42]